MGSVTLDKVYFETLLRKAQFHTSGLDFTTPVNLPMVTIPKIDHDALLVTSREYGNLRRNLYNGGISDETLALLIRDDAENFEHRGQDGIKVGTAGESTTDGDAFLTQESFASQTPARADRASRSQPIYVPRNGFKGAWDEDESVDNGVRNHRNGEGCTFESGPEGFENGYSFDGSGQNGHQADSRPPFESVCKRTIQFYKLPKGVTYADVIETIRGGMVVDLFLRSQDRSANVSFLEAADAQQFFRHVKQNNLYIGRKQVEIRWSDRQFILPKHVAYKLTRGATRNLVIRNYSKIHTEKMIRDDLEHIHNLVVIKITFVGQDAHISTNSVHNASFARTCMMSRGVYRGSKIDWDADECAAPIESREKTAKQSANHEFKSLSNRYEVLNREATETDSFANSFDDSGATF